MARVKTTATVAKAAMTDEMTDTMTVVSETGITVIEEDFLPNDHELIDGLVGEANGEFPEEAMSGLESGLESKTAKLSIAAPTPNATILDIDPDDLIVLESRSNLRDRETKEYQNGIAQLSQDILDEGQFEPCIGALTDEGIVLIAGERRRDAVKLLRADGQNILLKIVIQEFGDTAANRIAVMENISRSNFSPLEMAQRVIPMARVELKRIDPKSEPRNVDVGNWLGISAAQVGQYEKIGRAPQMVQEDVRTGKWSMDTALEFLATPDGKQAVVKAAAEKKAAEEPEKELKKAKAAAEKAEEDKKKAKEKREPMTQEQKNAFRNVQDSLKRANAKAEAARLAEAKGEKPAVQAKHVREAKEEIGLPVKASKATESGEGGKKAKSAVSEVAKVIELCESLSGSAYQPVMNEFMDNLGMFCRGECSVKVVRDSWNAVSELIPDSEPEADAVPEPKTETKPKANANAHDKLEAAKAKAKAAASKQAADKQAAAKKTAVKKTVPAKPATKPQAKPTRKK